VISLELAKRLKAAGLRWEPQKAGDWFFDIAGKKSLIMIDGLIPNNFTWLPSLDQILDKIEAQGFIWYFRMIPGAKWAKIPPSYRCAVREIGWEILYEQNGDYLEHAEEEPTREDAAGLALLWILERSQNEPRD
jgi:hypothetical protein